MKKIIYVLSIFISAQFLQAQSWTELGATNPLPQSSSTFIYSICSDPAGNIYAGGFGLTVNKFDGTSWSALGGQNPLSINGAINSICSDAAGNIYAAGVFRNSLGKQYVAKYDGSSWTELGGLNGLGANNNIMAICTDPSGNIYAAGMFTNTAGKCYVAKFNGSTWSEVVGLNNTITSGFIRTICSDPSGNIYVAGNFNHNGGHCVAKYNGSTWNILYGIMSTGGDIYALCSDALGKIYVEDTGSNTVHYWNGNSWVYMAGSGYGPNSIVESLCSDPSGNIYAISNLNVYKWDGSTWSVLLGLQANLPIHALCSDPQGNIYVAGKFTNSSGKRYVAKYGTATTSGISNTRFLPNSLKLFPNPLSESAKISFTLNRTQKVTLKVFDINGSLVSTLIENNFDEGKNELDLSFEKVNAGVYFIQLQSEENLSIEKIIVTK